MNETREKTDASKQNLQMMSLNGWQGQSKSGALSRSQEASKKQLKEEE